MSKLPIAILDENYNVIGPRYAEAIDARKTLKGLEPGTYHLVRFLNEDIVVAEKPAVVKHTVDMGTTFIRRPNKKSMVPSANSARPGA